MGPQQFKNFEGFMLVLERAAKGHGKESMTAQFQETGKMLSKNAGSTIAQTLASPVSAAKEAVLASGMI